MKLREIPVEQFAKDLKELQSWMPHYIAIKKEFECRGNWKPKPRGIGFKKGEDSRRSNIAELARNSLKVSAVLEPKPIKHVVEHKVVFGNLYGEKK